MPKTVKPLTATQVDALRTEKAQQDFTVGGVPGLILRVSKTGRKTWMLQYRAHGRPRRMKFGSYPSLSLKEAREKGWRFISQVESGEDPLRIRNAKRDRRHSFDALAQEALTSLAQRTRESTRKERARIVEAELLPRWRGRPASEITREEVGALVKGIAQRGSPAMANRTLSLIRLIFNEGISLTFPALERNPAEKIRRPGEESGRDRYLDRTEIKAIWDAAGEEDLGSRALIRLGLLTAQRMGSICSMRWEDLSDEGDHGLWMIPKQRFKGKRIHLVPLVGPAWELVRELREHAFSPEYAFPGRSDSRRPYRSNWKGVVKRLRRRTGIEDWSAHDFRTTFRTWAVRAKEARNPGRRGLGISPYVADRVLGHQDQSIGARHYEGDPVHYFLHEKREALASWADFIREVIG